jgi:hypothetical protein
MDYIYFTSIDFDPEITTEQKLEQLAYLRSLLPENSRAKIKHNDHDFGGYYDIQIELLELHDTNDCEEDIDCEDCIEAYKDIDAINEAVNQYFKKYTYC